MDKFRLKWPIGVGILYFRGTSGDLEDTLETVEQLQNALTDRGHVVRTMRVTRENYRQAAQIPGMVIFNLVEDPTWELYMKVGRLLEYVGRAQVAHDLKSFNYVLKKAAIKKKLEQLGLASPKYRLLKQWKKASLIRGMEYPLIVKPSAQHAGIGISQDSVVIDAHELGERVEFVAKNFPGGVVVEEFIEGREIHVTVVGNGRQTVTLPYSELEFDGDFSCNWNVYSYDAKWTKESWEYWNVPVRSPITVSPLLDRRIATLASRAYAQLGCRDIARFDMRIDEKERPFIIDVNMNPSLKCDELDATWMSAKAAGWSYGELIELLVGITYKRVYGRLPSRIMERQLLLEARA